MAKILKLHFHFLSLTRCFYNHNGHSDKIPITSPPIYIDTKSNYGSRNHSGGLDPVALSVIR